ncbi:MAG: TetR/AcrR family transcriptional regulator [Bacteroides sp.]|nr:TetR/AcrR family transcriptional regulator [Bacteroides sp.]
MVSKTRDRLIEVARQLFVNKGVENTTMNDIATASEKGRRTIYTYFKNKREIYNAVLEQESNAIISKLKEIIDSDLSTVEKLRQYLLQRFDAATLSGGKKSPRDRYRTIFSRDARRVEKIFDMARKKEQQLLSDFLQSGVNEGIFDPDQAQRLPFLMTMICMSIDHLKMNTIPSGEIDFGLFTDKIIDFLTVGTVNKSTSIYIKN